MELDMMLFPRDRRRTLRADRSDVRLSLPWCADPYGSATRERLSMVRWRTDTFVGRAQPA